MKTAFDAVTTNGRGGRGVVVFWSSGNGGENRAVRTVTVNEERPS